MVMLDVPGWADNIEEWTPERYVEEFHSALVTFALTRWQGWARSTSGVDHNDIPSIAAEGLIKASRLWPAWAQAHNLPPHEKRLFYAYAKQVVSYAFLDWHKGIIGRNEKQRAGRSALRLAWSLDAMASASLTPLDEILGEDEPEPSMLHQQTAMAVARLQRTEQVLVALLHFEKLQRQHIAKLLGVPSTAITKAEQRTAYRLHCIIRNLIDDEHHHVPTAADDLALTGALITHICERHRLSVDEWLAKVQNAYANDIDLMLSVVDGLHRYAKEAS